MESLFYRYRIYDDPSIPHTGMNIEGYNIYRKGDKNDGWYVSPIRLTKLDKYIRSVTNPEGLLEYEEINAFGMVSYKPPMENPNVFYTRDELYQFNRRELQRVAHLLSINTVNIKDDLLIKKIIQEQRKYQIDSALESLEKSLDEIEKIKEETPEAIV